jgi:hypothetical protein
VWKRLASQSNEQGNMVQTVYCLTRVLRMTPDDVNARWDRALLYARMGDIRKVWEYSKCVPCMWSMAHIYMSRDSQLPPCASSVLCAHTAS